MKAPSFIRVSFIMAQIHVICNADVSPKKFLGIGYWVFLIPIIFTIFWYWVLGIFGYKNFWVLGIGFGYILFINPSTIL